MQNYLYSDHFLHMTNINQTDNSTNTPIYKPKISFLNLSIIVTLFSFIILAALIGGSIVYFQSLRYQDSVKTSSISVTGTAEKKVLYDKLTMAFTISKSGTDIAALNTQVDDLTNKAQDILTKNNIKKEDIQTNKSSYPDYGIFSSGLTIESEKNVPKKTVFDVRFSVKVKDLQNNLSLPNNIAKQLVDISVDRFEPYQYEVAGQKNICEDLKSEAIVNARENAFKQINAVGGKKIVSSQIQASGEGCDSSGFPYPIGFSANVKSETDSYQSQSPEVVTGEKNISQQVLVNFEYR